MRYVTADDTGTYYLAKLDADTGNIVLVEAGFQTLEPTQGPQGERGIAGEMGPSLPSPPVLHGDGPPSDTDPITDGVDGQLYMDDLTGDLYERTSGLWL